MAGTALANKPILPQAPLTSDGLIKWSGDLMRTLQTVLGDTARKANETPVLPAISPLTANLDADGFDISNVGTLTVTNLIATNILPKWETLVHAATVKATPVDADELGYLDSAASYVLKRMTWGNAKAFLKTYFDSLYQLTDADLTSWALITRATGFDTFVVTPSSANLLALLTTKTGTGSAVFSISPALTGSPTAPTQAPGDNTTNIASTAFVTAAAAAVARGYTALGTITTTSGASQTLSSLVLTSYKFLKLSLQGVSGTNSGTINITINGVTIGVTTAGAGAVSGMIDIDLTSGIMGFYTGGAASTTPTLGGGASGLTTASTAITVAISAGTFDAGSIRVYGI